MRNIKTYESFDLGSYIPPRDINQFIDLVFPDVRSKVGNLYDMFQDYEDDGYRMLVDVGLKGPDYEEGYNRDIIDLFIIDKDLNISDSIVDDGSRSGYVDWIIKNDFDLILEDVVFVIYFFLDKDHNKEWKKFQNIFDEFLSRMNSMFDYTYIDHSDYSDIKEAGIRLTCQL